MASAQVSRILSWPRAAGLGAWTSSNIIVLSESAQSALLNAVPSFQPVWQQWLADQADYVARFPEELLSEADQTREFFTNLASHLGERVAAGDLVEAEWLFAALERIYADADDELIAQLTVGFLESLIYSIEYSGGSADVLHHVQKGPASAWGWRTAFEYIHPRA
jgi:hypothetical protein